MENDMLMRVTNRVVRRVPSVHGFLVEASGSRWKKNSGRIEVKRALHPLYAHNQAEVNHPPL